MASKHLTDRQLAIIRNRQGENIPIPPERKHHKHEESVIQRAVVNWWRAACPSFEVPEQMLMSIPNGGGRANVMTAVTLKREGLRKGVSDLFLAVIRGRYGGLFIEMKRPSGKLTPEQRAFQENVTAQGYAAFTCYSAEQATALISDYINGQPIF